MTSLEALALRHVLSIDARGKPVLLTVHMEYGPRTYAGETLDDAARRALAAMERKETEHG